MYFYLWIFLKMKIDYVKEEHGYGKVIPFFTSNILLLAVSRLVSYPQLFLSLMARRDNDCTSISHSLAANLLHWKFKYFPFLVLSWLLSGSGPLNSTIKCWVPQIRSSLSHIRGLLGLWFHLGPLGFGSKT